MTVTASPASASQYKVQSFVFTRRALLRTLSTLAAADLLRGQDAPTFSSDVKIINLFATVRNDKGETIRNLNKEDFVLQEEGRPQEIKYFSRESDLPLSLGLVVDTSFSTKKVLPDERTAARTFLEQVLRVDKDQAFVLHFDHEVELLRDLTNSRPKLQKAIDELETAERTQTEWDSNDRGSGRGGGGGGMGWPGSGRPGGGGRGRAPGGNYPRGGGSHHGGGTLLYDAILLASDEIMKKQKGRKALIVLSDGEDSGSKTTMRSAISSAQRSDSLIYTVLFKGESGRQVMEQLAKETGGTMITISGKTPVEKAFSQFGDELRSQYSLGYSSDNKSNDGGFRKILLTSKQPSLVVQTRDGYWADGE